MAKFNLIKNGILRSVTVSGVYNKELSSSELASLVDEVTTTSGVQLVQSDVLCLEADLGQRIKVDGIHLYTNDLTKLNFVDFQFKDYETDTFTMATKGVSSVYYANIPEPSAPRYIRCTISGVALTINEFKILNNDYIVEFGTDGTEVDTWLRDTPIGTKGTPQEIEIYNNTVNPGIPTNAMVCVDYTGLGKDHYIEIANKIDGAYLGYKEGYKIGHMTNDWDLGTYSNTYKEGFDNSIRLIDKGTVKKFWNNIINQLPDDSGHLNGTPFGINDAVSYDVLNNVIYVAIYNGSTKNNGVVSLYKYTINTNVWLFVSVLNGTDLIDAEYISICYNNNKIYYFHSAQNYLFVHDLAGSSGNYTQLSSYYIQNYQTLRKFNSLTTDGGDWLYCMCDCLVSSYYPRSFQRYEISTDTWYLLSASNISVGNDMQKLVYDTTLDVIYYTGLNGTHKHIQRYSVIENSWQTSYFSLTRLDTDDSEYMNIEFYNDKLYFCNSAYTTEVYVLDITTNTIDSIHTDFSASNSFSPYFIPIIPSEPDDVVSLVCMNIEGDLYNVYGYNTGFEQDSAAVIRTPNSGTYVTPILIMENPFMTSFFTIDVKTEAGKSSLSKYDDVHDGVIEVRASNTPPVSIDEIFWGYLYPFPTNVVGKYDVRTGIFTTTYYAINLSNNTSSVGLAIDKRKGRVYTSVFTLTNTTKYGYVHDRYGNLLYSKVTYDQGEPNKEASIDGSGGIWELDLINDAIYHLRFDLTYLNHTACQTVSQLSACVNTDQCWFVDSDLKTVNKLSSECTFIVSVLMGNPYGVSSTSDNGCWVTELQDLEYNNSRLKRLDSDGNIIFNIEVPDPLYRIASLPDDSCYALTSTDISKLYHFDKDGNLMDVKNNISAHFIDAGNNGCVLLNDVTSLASYYSYETKTIIWQKNYYNDIYNVSLPTFTKPSIFSWTIVEDMNYAEDMQQQLLPLNEDPLWYGEDGLEWHDIPKDGYFLNKNNYHQIRLTLRNHDGESTPIVNTISMAPTVTIDDIQPKESKPVYVRSSIPSNESATQFDTRIKVWWSTEE